MQILLDECLPKKLKAEFMDHTVFTVQEKGWAGMKNGELLRRAEKGFDVWVTAARLSRWWLRARILRTLAVQVNNPHS